MKMNPLLYLILSVLALNCVLYGNSVDLDSKNEEEAMPKVADSELKFYSDNLNDSSTSEVIGKESSQAIKTTDHISALYTTVSKETSHSSSSASKSRFRRSSARIQKDAKGEKKRGVAVVNSSPISDSRRRRRLRTLKPGTRLRPDSIKSKLEEENNYDDDYDYDYDNDYDYEDNNGTESVYGVHHLRHEIYNYVDGLVNESALEEFRAMKERITLLEDRLRESDAHTSALEEFVRISLSPRLGDLRLVVEGETGQRGQEGYLQFYTGSAWGFVCDDFFKENAAKVACKQLMFSGVNAKAQTAPTDNTTKDEPWMLRFNTVLDDVTCLGGEKTLYSCGHSSVGEHDCYLKESVYLKC